MQIIAKSIAGTNQGKGPLPPETTIPITDTLNRTAVITYIFFHLYAMKTDLPDISLIRKDTVLSEA
jgi:hypothetical protein